MLAMVGFFYFIFDIELLDLPPVWWEVLSLGPTIVFG